MHIFIILWSIFAAWKWGDWRNWRNYHATILFMPLANLMYGLLVNDQNFYLWRYQSDYLFSQETTDVFYTVIVFPTTVLIFLSNYPKGKIPQIIHISKYVVLFCILEIIGLHVGAIKHSQGWTMLWSTTFNIITFLTLRLHHEKPITAYIFSVIFIWFMLLHFNVPLTDKE
jgi:hypothetical protein